MLKLLLHRGDAAGIFAFYHAAHLRRQFKMPLFDPLTVSDYVHGNIGIDISEDVEVQIDLRVDFYNVLASHFTGHGVFDYRHGTVERAEIKYAVKLHALPRSYVVKHYAVLYRINIHI